MLSHSPSFKRAKVKSIREIDSYCERDYEKNIKAAVDAGGGGDAAMSSQDYYKTLGVARDAQDEGVAVLEARLPGDSVGLPNGARVEALAERQHRQADKHGRSQDTDQFSRLLSPGCRPEQEAGLEVLRRIARYRCGDGAASASGRITAIDRRPGL